MLYADMFNEEWPKTEAEVNGQRIWVFSRPQPGPFLIRLIAAWRVLRGRAEAVSFLGQGEGGA